MTPAQERAAEAMPPMSLWSAQAYASAVLTAALDEAEMAHAIAVRTHRRWHAGSSCPSPESPEAWPATCGIDFLGEARVAARAVVDLVFGEKP